MKQNFVLLSCFSFISAVRPALTTVAWCFYSPMTRTLTNGMHGNGIALRISFAAAGL